jgi:hypothetical protein
MIQPLRKPFQFYLVCCPVSLPKFSILNMERWCCVEAKTFVFTVLERASVVRLEERRKSFSGLVLLSAQSIEWLALTIENLQWCSEEKDFIRSFREGSKVLIFRQGGNAAGRFLEVAVYGVGGRRGIIFIPEGRDGRGWRSFVLELDKIRQSVHS